MSKQTCALCGNTADERYLYPYADHFGWECISRDKCQRRQRANAKANAQTEAEAEAVEPAVICAVEAPVTEVVDGEQVVVPVPTEGRFFKEYFDPTPHPDETWLVPAVTMTPEEAHTAYSLEPPLTDVVVPVPTADPAQAIVNEYMDAMAALEMEKITAALYPLTESAPDPKDKRAVVSVRTVHAARVTEHWVICTHCGDVAHRTSKIQAERARLFHIDEKHRF